MIHIHRILAGFLVLCIGAAGLAQTFPAPAYTAVTAHPTGVLRTPANFWTASAAAINAALGGAGVGAPGEDGADGREVELRATATHVQWRYVGTGTWNDLVALADLKGEDGAAGATGACYVDGIRAADTWPASYGVASTGTYTLGSRNNLNYLGGRLAEYAFFARSMSDAELAGLTLGQVSAARLRPHIYIPMVRDLRDLCGRATLTPNNSPTVAPHPRRAG